MYVLLLQHDMAKTLVWRHKLKYKPDMSNNMRQQRSMAFFLQLSSFITFAYSCILCWYVNWYVTKVLSVSL